MGRALALQAFRLGADVTVVAATTGLSGARPPGDDEDGGGTMAAGNVGLAGAGGGGITVVASTTGLSCAGPVGGIGPFPLRSGIAAGFSTGGATWMSGVGFGFGAVSFRRRLGKAAAERGAFAFPRRGAAFMMSSGGNGLPRRGTPRGSSQIHFTASLPPSVRMKLFFSRRCISFSRLTAALIWFVAEYTSPALFDFEPHRRDFAIRRNRRAVRPIRGRMASRSRA